MNLSIDTWAGGLSVSEDLYGVFFEEISHAGVDGLSSHLVLNSTSRRRCAPSPPWTAIPAAGVQYELSLNTSMPLTEHTTHSLRAQGHRQRRR